MTEKQISLWIYNNLGPMIREVLMDNPSVIYTEDWLAGIAHREVFPIIVKHAGKLTPAQMWPLMRGDYSQRKRELKPSYHGFSPWQIDIGSFPEFIASGVWKDPKKACQKAVAVLEGKRKYIVSKFPNLKGDPLHRAITAAYNCGEGNVAKVLRARQDIDSRTHGKDYSKMVWQYRATYRGIPAYIQHNL